MKKRIASLVLALLLCVGLSAPTMAVDNPAGCPRALGPRMLGRAQVSDGAMRIFRSAKATPFWSIGRPKKAPSMVLSTWRGIWSSPGPIPTTPICFYLSDGLISVPEIKYEPGVGVTSVHGRYMDCTGKTVIDLGEGRFGISFSDGLAVAVEYDESYELCKVGVIDRKGNVVIPFEYEVDGWEGLFFYDGLWVAGKKNEEGYVKWGYLDPTGTVAIPFDYDDARDFHDGLAIVGVDSGEKSESGYPLFKYGYIDTTGTVVIPLKYDSAEPFEDGRAVVGQRDAEGKWKYGMLNKNGDVTVPLQYNHIQRAAEGIWYASIRDNQGNIKYGYIGKNGTLTNMKYDEIALSFSEGLA